MASYTSAGNHRFSYGFGGVFTDRGYSLAVDANDNVHLTGVFAGTVDFGGEKLSAANSPDIFLASYTSLGTRRFSQRLGGSATDHGSSVAVDANGNIYLTGQFQKTASFGGDPLASAGANDVFLASYTAAGAHRFSHRFGGISSDFGTSVAVDASGNVYLTGYFQGSAAFGGATLTSAGADDIFLASYTAAGAHRFSQRFGATNYDSGNAAAVDQNGNVYLTGYFSGTVDFGGGPSTSAGGYDIFFASYTSSGEHRFSQRFGAGGTDEGRSLAVDANGNVYLTGSFSGTEDFGGGPLTSAGDYDVFLLKLAPP